MFRRGGGRGAGEYLTIKLEMRNKKTINDLNNDLFKGGDTWIEIRNEKRKKLNK